MAKKKKLGTLQIAKEVTDQFLNKKKEIVVDEDLMQAIILVALGMFISQM